MPDAAQLPELTARRGEGRRALLEAARTEFEELGYTGTNSNTIARRAGFAPQTFYRHFKDKLAIFLEVYAAWVAEEGVALAGATSARAFAEAIIAHHVKHKVFRRSLRALTVEDPAVGAARAAARLTQIEALARNSQKFAARSFADQCAALLTIERLCDAVADGDYDALGVAPAEAKATVIRAIRQVVDLA